MIVRQLFIAGLCATASLAQAGPLEASADAPRAASFAVGSHALPAALSSAPSTAHAGPGRWSMHSRLGDSGAYTTMLFAGSGPKAANFTGAPSILPEVQAAPAPIVHTPSETLPEVAVGTGNQVVLPPVTDMVDAIRDLPAVTPIVVAPIADEVPEPGTGLLMLAGLMGVGMLSRRRRK